jgi:BirA family transcriptional regulator, biotin operon repressor / biotin---[acetyl-CoA-carboxylase] ligase
MRVARTRSTQDVVLKAARDGTAEGFCCLAEEQTAGRGRQGRSWTAPPGSALLASVLLRRSPAVTTGIPFAAGLALVDALSSMTGVAPRLKWPNDVLVDGHKLAGILSEVEPAASTPGRLAIALGLGVNLRVDQFPAGVDAVSLHTLVDRPPDAEALLLEWGEALGVRLATLEDLGIAGILGDWRRSSVGLGGPVTVLGPAGSVEGIAIDVDDDGALLVDANGEMQRFLAGDVHLR